MKFQVYIRADGSHKIGLGHLVRCIALSQMLKDEFAITFLCKEIPDNLIRELEDIGIRINKIIDEDDFFATITSSCIVVLDGHQFDTDYQKQIKAKGSKLVCIDDLHDKEFFADLIINHAPEITHNVYNAQPYTQFALGIEYALLRPSFLEQAKKKRIINKIETLLICFGGSDLKNLTQSALEVALQDSKFKKIIVVMGSASIISKQFSTLLNSDFRIDLRQNINQMEMLSAMLESQVVIVPASGTLFEAISTGNISISGYYIDNQKDIYDGFCKKKAIIPVGKFGSQDILSALENLTSFKIKNVIDGKSDIRICSSFKQLIS